MWQMAYYVFDESASQLNVAGLVVKNCVIALLMRNWTLELPVTVIC